MCTLITQAHVCALHIHTLTCMQITYMTDMCTHNTDICTYHTQRHVYIHNTCTQTCVCSSHRHIHVHHIYTYWQVHRSHMTDMYAHHTQKCLHKPIDTCTYYTYMHGDVHTLYHMHTFTLIHMKATWKSKSESGKSSIYNFYCFPILSQKSLFPEDFSSCFSCLHPLIPLAMG